MQTYHPASAYFDGRKKIAQLIASSSGAELVAIGLLNLRDRRIVNMCISADRAGPGLTEAEAVRQVSQAIAPQLTLLRSDPALEPGNPSGRTGDDEPRPVWLKSRRHLIGIGNRTEHLAAFTALIFKDEAQVDTPDRRNLAQIGLTYADQLLHEQIGQAKGKTPMLPDAILRSLSFGFFVVDAGGGVDYVKDSAHGWLARNKELAIHGRRLSTRGPRNQQMLQNALVAAIGPQRKTSVLQLETMDDDLEKTIIVLPLQDNQPRALVIFGQEQEDRDLRDLVLQTFGLTLAERRLTHHLLAGRSLAEAAEEANLTISTARSYLKRIFAKTGMHRQSELVTLCHRLMPPIKAATPERPHGKPPG